MLSAFSEIALHNQILPSVTKEVTSHGVIRQMGPSSSALVLNFNNPTSNLNTPVEPSHQAFNLIDNDGSSEVSISSEPCTRERWFAMSTVPPNKQFVNMVAYVKRGPVYRVLLEKQVGTKPQTQSAGQSVETSEFAAFVLLHFGTGLGASFDTS